jgi:hypothetical protein
VLVFVQLNTQCTLCPHLYTANAVTRKKMNFTYLFLDKTNIEMVPKDCKTNILEATKSQVVVGYENSCHLNSHQVKGCMSGSFHYWLLHLFSPFSKCMWLFVQQKHLSFELLYNISDTLNKATRTFTIMKVLHNIGFCSRQFTTSWILNKKGKKGISRI